MDEMPNIALSVRQPWAWAIIYGGKDVENRTKYAITLGGMKPRRVCIHASKGMTRDEYETAARFMESIGVDCPRPDLLDRGSIIGTVDVTGAIDESDSEWFFGPWALTLQNAEGFHPIPSSGQLGYFNWRRDDNAYAEPLPWMRSWPERPSQIAKAAEPAVGTLL